MTRGRGGSGAEVSVNQHIRRLSVKFRDNRILPKGMNIIQTIKCYIYGMLG